MIIKKKMMLALSLPMSCSDSDHVLISFSTILLKKHGNKVGINEFKYNNYPTYWTLHN